MIINRVLVGTARPFDLTKVSMHCRTDGDAEFDSEIYRMAEAAVLEFEHYTQIALLFQNIEVLLEGPLRQSVFPLPIVPLLKDTPVQVQVGGQNFESFEIIAGLRPALRFTSDTPCGPIKITYQAGFGETAAHLPKDIENAIADQTSALFDLRGAGEGKSNGMSPHMARVAARYRRVRI